MVNDQQIKTFSIRTVQTRDEKRIWEIRNNQSTRMLFFSTDHIPYSQHQKWFKDYIKKQAKKFFVLEIQGIKPLVIGYCRYQPNQNQTTIEVSLAIDTKFRGHGWGTYLLQNTIPKVFCKSNQLIARIKPGNVTSQKFFTHSGFILTNSESHCLTYIYYLSATTKKRE